ncbi:lactococcin 972 family bacteriocin [Microbacterium sp. M1A1_1b]
MKKSILTIALCALTTLAGTMGASAASAATVGDTDATGGSVTLDSPKTARNGTQVVGGGIWTYAVSSGRVTSVYDNSKLVHSASVKSAGVTKSSGKVAKGKIASASRPSAFSGNQAFWNIY